MRRRRAARMAGKSPLLAGQGPELAVQGSGSTGVTPMLGGPAFGNFGAPPAAAVRPAPTMAPVNAPTASPPPALEPSTSGEVRPQQRRRNWLKLSAFLCILLPTILAGLYYAFWAANQYTVEFRFAVRGPASKTSGDLGGLLATVSGSPSSTVTDSYIVMDYVRSREIIERMAPLVDVRKVYANPAADWVMRLNPKLPIEDLVEYWRGKVELGYDTGSQVITVKVRAFSPGEAKRVAEAIITLSEDLINQLSERARKDSVKYAEIEVQRTEERLKANRAALRLFRDQRQEIDPVKTAEAQLAQVARLEADLSATRAQIDTLRTYMSENAPNIAYLKSKLAAVEQQLAEERKKLGAGQTLDRKRPTLSGLVADYEELVVEREFAEKAYVSALASLERARIEAVQQQRYLATFVNPSLPQESLYPKRILNTLLILAGCFVLWGLGVLLVYAIRDHTM